MERSCDTNLRDMLDEVARMLKMYQTEKGAKQSFKYEVGFTSEYIKHTISFSR